MPTASFDQTGVCRANLYRWFADQDRSEDPEHVSRSIGAIRQATSSFLPLLRAVSPS